MLTCGADLVCTSMALAGALATACWRPRRGAHPQGLRASTCGREVEARMARSTEAGQRWCLLAYLMAEKRPASPVECLLHARSWSL